MLREEDAGLTEVKRAMRTMANALTELTREVRELKEREQTERQVQVDHLVSYIGAKLGLQLTKDDQ